ncbi:fimbrial protein [Enterobacteriaceae bacterium LUAb1]
MLAQAQAQTCQSEGDCSISVNFQGIYLEETCDVSINNGGNSGTVNLPTISTIKLQRAGDEAGSTPFQISLKNCPVSRDVGLYFFSIGNYGDGVTGNIKNSSDKGFSKDVQIRIYNSEKLQMRIDDVNSEQNYVIPSDGDDVTHYFYATYYAKNFGAVTSGEVHAVAGIELIYK